MPSKNGRRKLSEKGLLTPDNCVVALIDLQPQMLFGVSNFDRQSIFREGGEVTAVGRDQALLDRGRAHQFECGRMQTFPGLDHGRLINVTKTKR